MKEKGKSEKYIRQMGLSITFDRPPNLRKFPIPYIWEDKFKYSKEIKKKYAGYTALTLLVGTDVLRIIFEAYGHDAKYKLFPPASKQRINNLRSWLFKVKEKFPKEIASLIDAHQKFDIEIIYDKSAKIIRASSNNFEALKGASISIRGLFSKLIYAIWEEIERREREYLDLQANLIAEEIKSLRKKALEGGANNEKRKKEAFT